MTAHITPAAPTDPASPTDPGAAGGQRAPVLALDLRTSPALVDDLAAIGRALEASHAGAVVLSGDAERGELHPIHVAAALAPHTRALSLIAHADAALVEPFHLATQLMSLDHVSHGRAGWLVQARSDATAAEAVGREAISGEDLATETADVVDAARRIWDSWTDDAVVRDVERGVYVDASRLQYADAEGATFSVRGPAITPRSPQGQVPVLVADEDADSVGPAVRESLADARVLDVDVSGLASAVGPDAGAGITGGGAVAIADRVRAALAESDTRAAGDGAAGPGIIRVLGALPAATAQAATARAVTAQAVAVAGETVAAAAAILRSEGLVAPIPAPGTSLREQLGLSRPEVAIDPARRADRARRAPEAPAA